MEIDEKTDLAVMRYHIRRRPGALQLVKVKAVCAGCNSGWMSHELEEPVRPILEKMFRNQPMSVTTDDQTVLAAWATKTAMMWEYDDPSTRVSTQEHRTHLFKHLHPSTDTFVWLGRNASSTRLRLYHQPLLIQLKGVPERGRPNYQSTLMIFGRVLLVVGFFDEALRHIKGMSPSSDKLTRIWPCPKVPVAWPHDNAHSRRRRSEVAIATAVITVLTSLTYRVVGIGGDCRPQGRRSSGPAGSAYRRPLRRKSGRCMRRKGGAQRYYACRMSRRTFRLPASELTATATGRAG